VLPNLVIHRFMAPDREMKKKVRLVFVEDSHIAGKFDDSALMKIFGQSRLGAFAAPTIAEKEVVRQYSVVKIGEVKEVRERYYATSVERKPKHPAILLISRSAKENILKIEC